MAGCCCIVDGGIIVVTGCVKVNGVLVVSGVVDVSIVGDISTVGGVVCKVDCVSTAASVAGSVFIAGWSSGTVVESFFSLDVVIVLFIVEVISCLYAANVETCKDLEFDTPEEGLEVGVSEDGGVEVEDVCGDIG